MPEIEIGKRDSFEHYLSVDSANKKICFEFSTKKKNIAFGIFFRAYGRKQTHESNFKELITKFITAETLSINQRAIVEVKRLSKTGSDNSVSEMSNLSITSETGLESKKNMDISGLDTVCILPVAKYESYKYQIKGFLVTPLAGTYIFCFDNTFSINTAKKLNYQIEIHEENEKEEEIRDESYGSWMLKKKRKKIQGWTKYWVKFENGILAYYSTPESPARGVINVANATVSKVPSTCSIIIDSGSQIFRLKALNQEDYFHWIRVINKFKGSKAQVRHISNSELSKINSLFEHTSFNQKTEKIVQLQEEIGSLRLIYQEIVDGTRKAEVLGTDSNPSSLHYLLEDLKNGIDRASSILMSYVMLISKDHTRSISAESSLQDISEVFYDAEEMVDADEEIYSDLNDTSSLSEEQSQTDFMESNNSSVLETFLPVINSRRTSLPVPMQPFNFSIGSFLRKNIGKDFSNISMPIAMNEPLNILQRMCEDLEYCDLLDLANSKSSSIDRLSLVAAFAVSSYGNSSSRVDRKPFTPLLGESFECVRQDKGFKFISEKISHRPLIIACNAISRNFEFWQHQQPKTKFWGKSMEITPNSHNFVRLASSKEVFYWNKVTSSIKNILGGTPSIEHYGEMKINNQATGECCVLNFKGSGLFSSSNNEIFGYITDASGNKVRNISGSWNLGLHYESAENANFELWKCNALPQNSKDFYGFSSFAMELNELNPELEKYLPPTDTRLRPDQRAFENGDIENAEQTKVMLEERQRERRKEMEDRKEPWKPLWFRPTFNSALQTEIWISNERYWVERDSQSFHKKLLLW